MTKTITLRHTNQGFTRCVRNVEAGEDGLITRNCVLVGRLPAASGRTLAPEPG